AAGGARGGRGREGGAPVEEAHAAPQAVVRAISHHRQDEPLEPAAPVRLSDRRAATCRAPVARGGAVRRTVPVEGERGRMDGVVEQVFTPTRATHQDASVFGDLPHRYDRAGRERGAVPAAMRELPPPLI